MILNDIGKKADALCAFLGFKTTVFIVFPGDFLYIVPAIGALAEDGFIEIEHTGKMSVRADEIPQFVVLHVEDLADGKRIIFRESFPFHFLQKFTDASGMFQHFAYGAQAVVPIRCIVAERQRLLDIDDRVDAETAQAFVQPPVDVFVNFLTYLWVFPVQIRLLFMKDMKILFVRARERFPYGTAEAGAPVAGPSVFLVGKVKKLSVRTVRILFCRFKPGMLVGAVVDHQIHQQIHTALFCLGDQFVHIFHGAEPWIDGVIIGNVVALICQGRFIDRG